MGLGCRNAFVALGAIAFAPVVDFYRQLLNQDPHPYREDVYAEFGLPGLRLAIFQPQATHSNEFDQSVGSGLSICLEVENLEEAIAHVQALGYCLSSNNIKVASHGREIYLYDPADNRLILHESWPKSQD